MGQQKTMQLPRREWEECPTTYLYIVYSWLISSSTVQIKRLIRFLSFLSRKWVANRRRWSLKTQRFSIAKVRNPNFFLSNVVYPYLAGLVSCIYLCGSLALPLFPTAPLILPTVLNDILWSSPPQLSFGFSFSADFQADPLKNALQWSNGPATPAQRSLRLLLSNYAAVIGEQDSPTTTIYGGNMPRLQQLKRRYDPHNVFRHNRNIPPAKE